MEECFCGRTFWSEQALDQHTDAKGYTAYCSCGRSFNSEEAVGDHQRAKGYRGWSEYHDDGTGESYSDVAYDEPFICDIYDDEFDYVEDLDDHMADEHPECPTCDKMFRHMSAFCDRFFTTAEGLGQHNRDYVHVGSYYWCDCEREFSNQEALDQHLQNSAAHRRSYVPPRDVRPQPPGRLHKERNGVPSDRDPSGYVPRKPSGWDYSAVGPSQNAQPQPSSRMHEEPSFAISARDERGEMIFTCVPCKRDFFSGSAFAQHLDSITHPLSDLECTLSDKCEKRFTLPSALIQHIESGECRSGMNRERLTSPVVEHDTEHVITSKETAPAPQTITDRLTKEYTLVGIQPVVERTPPPPSSVGDNSTDLIGLHSVSTAVPARPPTGQQVRRRRNAAADLAARMGLLSVKDSVGVSPGADAIVTPDVTEIESFHTAGSDALTTFTDGFMIDLTCPL